ISLGAEARYGRSSSGSRSFSASVFDSFRGNGDFTGAGGFFFPMTTPSPAPPLIQTTLCPLAFLLSRLQRINPTMRTTCATAMRATLPQKRRFFGIVYFASALVPIDRNRLHLRGSDRRIFANSRRNNEAHAALEQRRRDHENNQQYEREIEQRGDVDLGKRGKTLPLRVTPHLRNADSRTV